MEQKKPNDIDVNVGQRIRMRRKVLRESQTTLADVLGITFRQVQKYETGMNRVGASRLQHIASYLNVPVSHFFEDMPTLSDNAQAGSVPLGLEADEVETFLGSPLGKALNRAFKKIADPAVRKNIIALVKSVAGGDDSEPKAA